MICTHLNLVTLGLFVTSHHLLALALHLLKMRRRDLLLTKFAVVVADVIALDDSSSKVPGRNTLLEQDIKLSIGPSLWLGKAEEGPHEAEEARSSIEETCFGAPIPRARVQHAGSENIAND